MGKISFHLKKIHVSTVHVTQDHLVDRQAKFLYKIVVQDSWKTQKCISDGKNQVILNIKEQKNKS